MNRLLLALAAVLALALAPASAAAVRTWVGIYNAYWSVPVNWEDSILPENGDTLHFPAGAAPSTVNDLDTLEWVDSIQLDDNFQGQGNGLEVRNGLTIAPNVTSLVFGGLRVAQSQTWSGGAGSLGVEITSPAVLTVTPDTTMNIHVAGTGTLLQTGGTVRVTTPPNCRGPLTRLRTIGGEMIVADTVTWEWWDDWSAQPAIEVDGDPCTANGCSGGLTLDGYVSARSIAVTGGAVRPVLPASGRRSATGNFTLGPGARYEVPVTPVFGRRPKEEYNRGGFPVDVRSPLHVGWQGSQNLCHIGFGTVTLNDAVLDVTVVDRLAGCTTLTIIDNDGYDAVVGTFAGLPEGATFTTASGQTLRISYVGGTGNDVTITALDGLAHCSPVDSDLTGDRESDVVWRDSATGYNTLWTQSWDVNQAELTVSALPQVPDTNWKIVAATDFDGDGKNDLLWRHAVTGDNYLWRMNGATVLEVVPINVVPDVNWEIAGTGDFDADGRADILWRHRTSGENYLYRMNGSTIVSAGPLPAVPDTDWTIEGAGDLDADGDADIVWHHALTGDAYGWLMDGFAVASVDIINSVPDTNWTINSVADFDADRKDDILWRNTATGEIYLYSMDGTTILRAGTLTKNADLSWDVAATGDYDGDGRSDLFWRRSNGQNYVYLVNGFTVTLTVGVASKETTSTPVR